MSSQRRNTSPEIWERAYGITSIREAEQHDCRYLAAGQGTESQYSAILRSTWNIYLAFGLPPMHHFAESWMEWGGPITISEAEQGDTVILRMGKVHHVALWQAWNGEGLVRVFGGCNGQDARSSDFPRTAIRAIRRLRL